MEIEEDNKQVNVEDKVHSNQFQLDGVQIVDSAAEEQKVINKMEKKIKDAEKFVSCSLQCTVSLSSAKSVKKRVKGLLETETNLSLEEKSTYEVKYILLKMFTRALKQGNMEILPATNVNTLIESDVDHGHITPFASGLKSKKIISQTPIKSEPILNKKIIRFSLPPVTKSNEAIVVPNSPSEHSTENNDNKGNSNKKPKKSFDPFGQLLNKNNSNEKTEPVKRKKVSIVKKPERDLFGEILLSSSSSNKNAATPKTTLSPSTDLIYSMAKANNNNNKLDIDAIFDSYNYGNNNDDTKPKKIQTKSISKISITECPHCFKQFNNETDTPESIKQHIRTCDKICVVDRVYPEYIEGENHHIVDDGTDETYFTRLQAFLEWRKACRDENESLERKQSLHNTFIETVEQADVNSYYKKSYNFHEEIDNYMKNESSVTFEDGLKCPAHIFNQLFPYQQIGVQWFWELHCQNIGGILGDEMGLGKTIQVATFLGSLKYSNMMKTSLIVCPATVIGQWVTELHLWYPPLRVIVFHDSGTTINNGYSYDDILNSAAHNKIDVIITTYGGVRTRKIGLLQVNWQYVILDEGDKIKNPDIEITLICKQFNTYHRIILSGTPIQNNLKELWTLMDFVYPGLLSTLPTFLDQFSRPITAGGYSSATPMRIQIAYQCALTLKTLIDPYLLRRLKRDVNTQLPHKIEQILFCKLTDCQRKVYQRIIDSEFTQKVIREEVEPFQIISQLRKVCNHPDLLALREEDSHLLDGISAPTEEFGHWDRSGKLNVLRKMLPQLQQQGHKVLLFTQTKQMLNMMEEMVNHLGFRYCRMDGDTPISSRQKHVDMFNKDSSIFIFLLTTHVGGLGINLTGADYVIIYDPDWNPSTDIQARERAWRLGQTRDVTIYRMMTKGTIEEKIYHRQIYKQFLTDKILKDPNQKKFFKHSDLEELFTLQDEDEVTESTELFPEAEIMEDNIEDGLNQNPEEKSKAENEKNNASLLKALFNKTGLTNVFSHDVLEEDGTLSKDLKTLEKDAKSVSKQALDALQQSRAECNNPIGVPTWTGKNGTTSSRKRFGSKSSAVLISNRNNIESSDEILSKVKERKGKLNDNSPAVRLAKEIITFFKKFNEYKCTTIEILDYFNHNNTAVDNTPLFKELLHKIAKQKKNIWALRNEWW